MGGVILRPDDTNLSGSSSTTPASRQAANVGDTFEADPARRPRLLVCKLQARSSRRPPWSSPAGWPARRRRRRGGASTVATFNVENLDPGDGVAKYAARRPHRPQPPGADLPRRGGPGQRRPDQLHGHGSIRHVSPPSPRPFRPPAGRSTTGGRSIPSTTMTAASRVGTSVVPVPTGSRPRVRRPAGRNVDVLDGGAGAWRVDAAFGQPGPDRASGRRLHDQPQAAGWRVPLPRRDAVRRREPLQLQGWRSALFGRSSRPPARRRCSGTHRRRS